MTWTADQLRAEWDYIKNERLGLLCEDREPTQEQIKMARDEADRHVEELKKP